MVQYFTQLWQRLPHADEKPIVHSRSSFIAEQSTRAIGKAIRECKRSSVTQFMRKVSILGYTRNKDELEIEIERLRRKCEATVAKSWAEVERIIKDKEETDAKCLVLQEKVKHLERIIEKQRESTNNLVMKYNINDDFYNYDKENNDRRPVNYPIIERKDETSLFSKIKRVSMDHVKKTSNDKTNCDEEKNYLFQIDLMKKLQKEMKNEHDDAILDFELKLKQRDAAIANLEQTLKTQQMAMNKEIRELRSDTGVNEKFIQEKEIKIEELESQITKEKFYWECREKEMSDFTERLFESESKHKKETERLLRVIAKQRDYINALMQKIEMKKIMETSTVMNRMVKTYSHRFKNTDSKRTLSAVTA